MFRIYKYDDFIDLDIPQGIYTETEEEANEIVNELNERQETEDFFYKEVSDLSN